MDQQGGLWYNMNQQHWFFKLVGLISNGFYANNGMLSVLLVDTTIPCDSATSNATCPGNALLHQFGVKELAPLVPTFAMLILVGAQCALLALLFLVLARPCSRAQNMQKNEGSQCRNEPAHALFSRV